MRCWIGHHEIDAAGTLVWDRVARPFGETFLGNGSAANPQRFPGQYLDPETGYHYNYFRDYDPTTGRYLQSDPLGLAGGLNTCAYVAGSPVRFTDRRGETIDIVAEVAFILYDVYRILRDNLIGNCGNLDENLAALSADILTAFVPGATGFGLAIREISKPDSRSGNRSNHGAAAPKRTASQARTENIASGITLMGISNRRSTGRHAAVLDSAPVRPPAAGRGLSAVSGAIRAHSVAPPTSAEETFVMSAVQLPHRIGLAGPGRNDWTA